MDADRNNDDRWLPLAQAVSRGEPVDWDHVEHDPLDADENDVLGALRALEEIARVHKTGPAPTPGAPACPPAPALLRWRHLSIIERVGQGAFGAVYRAREDGLDREVALKLLWPTAADPAIEPAAVLNEARLLARVEHPNVVTVFGAESVGGQVGLWMEFIEGRTLEELLKLQGPFAAREAAAIGIDLCHALAAVHGAGLLHRDLKCQNVMRAAGGRIVLMDFGAGADLSARRPGAQPGVAGTPAYLAPELFDHATPSVASDIYSLGVLLYHLVSGAYPVEGDTKHDIVQAHVRRDRRRLRDARPDLPDGFLRVVERALEHDPAQRYQSAGAFGDELAHSLGLPTPRPTPRPQPRARLVAASAVLLAAVGAGAFWWSGGLARTGAQANAANAAAGSPPPAALPGPDAPYEIGAQFHVLKGAQGAALRPGDRLTPGDRLYLTVQTSKPAHLYVLNQDDHGESYLLFPLPGQSVTNPVQSGAMNQLPGTRDGEQLYFQVTSVGGREHFYIFASPRRLDEFEARVATLPRPTLDMAVNYIRLPQEVVGVLRGVGGLATGAPATTTTNPMFPTAQPLPQVPETAHGTWVRQIAFANPGNERRSKGAPAR